MYADTLGTYRSASALNQAMGRVYGHMMLAVITSMVVAGLVSGSAALMAFFFTGFMKWVTIFAPLVAVFGVTIALNARPPLAMATALLHGFAAIMGLSFASIFVVFNLGSVISAFMGAAVLFAVMSGYGYFTKQNLDTVGRYAFVALIAIVVVSIINLFLGSSVLQMIVSAIAILVFLALTAYDTQQIRESLSADSAGHTEEICGALSLYLDFINIFLSLLQLFGERKE
jgi:uncharacterized protein